VESRTQAVLDEHEANIRKEPLKWMEMGKVSRAIKYNWGVKESSRPRSSQRAAAEQG
jgi:hypothetical protein